VYKVWSEEKKDEGVLHYVECRGYAKEKLVKLVDEDEMEEWRLRLVMKHAIVDPGLRPVGTHIREIEEDPED
jgi:hypothetical protein